MNPSTAIVLVRHGHVHNPRDILYGRLPRFRLSARGIEEARAAGCTLAQADVAALYSSPLLRARQTAREIQSFHPTLPLRQSRYLVEIHSAYQGRPGAEVDALHGDVYTGAGPAYEQPADVVKRVRAFFTKVRRRHAGSRVAAVSHGDVIVFAMLWAAGLAPTPRHKAQLHTLGFAGGYPATGSLTTFVFRTGSPRELPAIRYMKPSESR
ncbi:MAG: histidine phosphatase family protein [Desulfobacterales bacterium]|jgi:broad specificity phosphatase PhoE|nr:histidine phosphatase family protein [Desulfobacterales bacterium]